MSQSARRFTPIATPLRRRFQAGYGGACPALSRRTRSGLQPARLHLRWRPSRTVPAHRRPVLHTLPAMQPVARMPMAAPKSS
jgi:hypothetical protein